MWNVGRILAGQWQGVDQEIAGCQLGVQGCWLGNVGVLAGRK